jgi:hypothetical protein
VLGDEAEQFCGVNGESVIIVYIQERGNGLLRVEGQLDGDGIGFLLEGKDFEVDFIAIAQGIGAIPLFEYVGIVGNTRFIV